MGLFSRSAQERSRAMTQKYLVHAVREYLAPYRHQYIGCRYMMMLPDHGPSIFQVTAIDDDYNVMCSFEKCGLVGFVLISLRDFLAMMADGRLVVH